MSSYDEPDPPSEIPEHLAVIFTNIHEILASDGSDLPPSASEIVGPTSDQHQLPNLSQEPDCTAEILAEVVEMGFTDGHNQPSDPLQVNDCDAEIPAEPHKMSSTNDPNQTPDPLQVENRLSTISAETDEMSSSDEDVQQPNYLFIANHPADYFSRQYSRHPDYSLVPDRPNYDNIYPNEDVVFGNPYVVPDQSFSEYNKSACERKKLAMRGIVICLVAFFGIGITILLVLDFVVFP